MIDLVVDVVEGDLGVVQLSRQVRITEEGFRRALEKASPHICAILAEMATAAAKEADPDIAAANEDPELIVRIRDRSVIESAVADLLTHTLVTA